MNRSIPGDAQPPRIQRLKPNDSQDPLDRAIRWIVRSAAALAILLVAFAAIAKLLPDTAPSDASRAVIPVTGLYCQVWCPVRIDHALDRLDGIYDVEIDFSQQAVSVLYDSSRVSVAEISTALGNHSYRPKVVPPKTQPTPTG